FLIPSPTLFLVSVLLPSGTARAYFPFRQPHVENIYEIILKINMIDKVFAKRGVCWLSGFREKRITAKKKAT
ncbi:TPA: hypothetical protein ACF23B_004496, partial [Klebsiella quasipneumoniae subsp. similipneumoniae]